MTMGHGVFSRGNVNVNSAESVYRLNPAYIAIGALMAIVFQSVVLAIAYFALDATVTAILFILILMAGGDVFLILVTVYSSRLYLREEMIDIASMFASYNPQILNGGSSMVSGALSTIQAAKKESRSEIQSEVELRQLISDLMQLRDELRGTPTGFIPLVDED